MSTVQISPPSPIDGVVPGVRGQRAFPTRALRYPDPFLMLDHIGPQSVPATFEVEGHPHPHRGFETVTLLFSGAMEHADTLGNRFWMRSGAVQVMNAGAGIQHGGAMKADPGHDEFHEIQLWVNVPAEHKLTPPQVQTHSADSIPTVVWPHGSARVIAGDVFGASGPVRTVQPIQVVHATLSAGATLDVPTPEGFASLVYVLRGSVRSQGQPVNRYATLAIPATEPATVSTSAGAELLCLAGLPIGEPVAMGGPFVMNTDAEIAQAFADFDAGLFGTILPGENL